MAIFPTPTHLDTPLAKTPPTRSCTGRIAADTRASAMIFRQHRATASDNFNAVKGQPSKTRARKPLPNRVE